MGSLRLLDPGQGDLAVDAFGVEPHLVADLDPLEHRRVLGAEYHGHAFVHVELLDRAVPERDLAGGFVDPGDRAGDQAGLGEGRPRGDRQGDDACGDERDVAHGLGPFFLARCADYLTTTMPLMPASRWPGMRQANSN